MIPFRHRLIKRDCLDREIYMVLFDVSGVKGQDMEWLRLAKAKRCGQAEDKKAEQKTHASNHRSTFLSGTSPQILLNAGLSNG
jgi:hypothetical protein